MKKQIKVSRKPLWVLSLIAALALGAGGGYYYGQGQGETASGAAAGGEREPVFYRHPMNPEITSPVPAKDDMGMDYIPVYAEEDQAERKPLFYRHPMNPEITSPVPAKDDMGMDYIPVYADGDAGAVPGTVKIDPVTVQNIGVRMAAAEKRTLAREIRTLGRVDYDEAGLFRYFPKIEGWVERLYVNKTGDTVRQGAPLFDIYSPAVVSSEEEYVLALAHRDALHDNAIDAIREGADNLVAATRERLRLLDVPESEIRRLEQTREVKRSITMRSPFTGVVTQINVRAGQRIGPETELYRIADLRRAWVYVDVYENELPWVREGDRAEMTLAALPGRRFRGRVSAVYPYLNSETRTARVRLEFANRDGALKPEMYGDVTVRARRQVDAIAIPTEAVVRSGQRQLVFIAVDEGKFVPREVRTGVASDGYTQVLEGVKAGETVVTSAQFLIDAESKLREAAAKMLEATPAKTDNAPKPEGQS